MTRDELLLKYVVLREYTDEHIDRELVGRDDRWAEAWRALRTVPADWRQSIWASAHHLAYRLVNTPYNGGFTQTYHVATTVDLFDAIEDRVETFHMGWRPMRMESVLVSRREIPLPREGE